MLDTSEIRGVITDTWRAAGLTGRGRRWTYVGPEIEWLLTHEGNWLGRLSMLADAKVRDGDGDDYPLRVFAEDLPTIHGHELLMALAVELKHE